MNVCMNVRMYICIFDLSDECYRLHVIVNIKHDTT